MIPEFDNLSEAEVNTLLKAPVYVTLLIAGADGKIDNNEIESAVSISKLKQSRARQALIEYYKVVGQGFEKTLREQIVNLPGDTQQRGHSLIAELEKLNRILPKLDQPFAIKFYQSLKDVAKKVAESSGGVLGFMSVSYEEAKLVSLKMIMDPADF
ncbi:MAG: hypothetical protein AAF363_15350 [Bacteroidota bacterium]